MFFLIAAIIGTSLALIDRFALNYEILTFKKGLLEMIFSLFIAFPFLSLTVRRLHDTNRSGWWLLLHLIPILGSIILLILLMQKSKKRINRYGMITKFQKKTIDN
ncbi:inner membrane protein YhaI [Patiriisocius marinistellae]|uniref:Inner membrane protein YhaI n=1 Tax=Patiriisocius marinistellae TaxID=2494560 RepID=A0A5J4FX58_9FLAO|nr:DUF805 domain-containing protein [Patiriisocius marinistellae]GEQ85714.1 inner membrane protein YhaI [Patiriisocius marinistellae]